MKLKDAHIIGYMAPTSGVHYHRILLPIHGLAMENSLVTNDIETIKDRIKTGRCDILLLSRYIQGLDWQELQELKKEYGFKIIVDNDDFWHLDPHHILYDFYEEGARAAITNNMQIADLVTVTHFRLAVKAMAYNTKVFVVPNALPYDRDQFTADRIERQEGEPIKIGWAGGITHEKDINILRGPMKRLAADPWLAQRIEMRLFGYNDFNPESKEIWGRMASAFTASGTLPYMAYPPLAVNQYMACYSEMDLAIIPLEDTPFNSYKSNLKILEAGAKNLPVICSRVLPYFEGIGIPGVNWVERQEDWVKTIRHYVKKPGQMAQDGLALGQWVRQNFHLDKWTQVRAALFSHILEEVPPRKNKLKAV